MMLRANIKEFIGEGRACEKNTKGEDIKKYYRSSCNAQMTPN